MVQFCGMLVFMNRFPTNLIFLWFPLFTCLKSNQFSFSKTFPLWHFIQMLFHLQFILIFEWRKIMLVETYSLLLLSKIYFALSVGELIEVREKTDKHLLWANRQKLDHLVCECQRTKYFFRFFWKLSRRCDAE